MTMTPESMTHFQEVLSNHCHPPISVSRPLLKKLRANGTRYKLTPSTGVISRAYTRNFMMRQREVLANFRQFPEDLAAMEAPLPVLEDLAGGPKYYQCRFCDFKAKRLGLISHLGEHIRRTSDFLCPPCDFFTNDRNAMTKHIKTAHGCQAPYKCLHGKKNCDDPQEFVTNFIVPFHQLKRPYDENAWLRGQMNLMAKDYGKELAARVGKKKSKERIKIPEVQDVEMIVEPDEVELDLDEGLGDSEVGSEKTRSSPDIDALRLTPVEDDVFEEDKKDLQECFVKLDRLDMALYACKN